MRIVDKVRFAQPAIRRLKGACYRIYSDFLMPDRLGIYHKLIRNLLDHGYRIHSVLGFWQLVESRALRLDWKYAVLRHDVDTDAATARRMWEVDRQLGVQSTYYFRKSTIDIPLMQAIHRSGCEASYHYEEIATLARNSGFTRRGQVEEAMPYLRELFRRNLNQLREITGLPMLTVASHGDFVNRMLGITNSLILVDHDLRRELNVVLEAYDPAFLQQMTSRCSDSPYPQGWDYDNPDAAILREEKRLHILIHPRQWHASRWVNMRDDAVRCWHGLGYQWAAHLQGKTVGQ